MRCFKEWSLLLLLFFTSLAAANSEIKTIAFAQDTMANDFRKAQVFEVRDAVAKHPDLQFVFSDAKGKTSLLIRQIEGFINSKVDLIIVGTNDADAVVPLISKAQKQGIPVIILDRGISGEDYTCFINSDNVLIGKTGAQYIAKKLQGKGVVLLFEGLQKADVTQLRSKGFLDEMTAHKGIKIIKRTGNYLRKDAILEMEKLIQQGVHIDAIFSQSDSMLSGVRSAMKHAGLSPSSLITVGCDYTNEAKEAILNNEQSASILFPLGGTQAVEIALKIFKGETVPQHIFIPVELITKENAKNIKPIF